MAHRWLIRVGVTAAIVAVLMVLNGRRTPPRLGLDDGKLTVCPDSPNCVSTQAQGRQRVAPLRVVGSVGQVMGEILKIADQMPRTRVLEREGTYVRLECTTLICRFTDDLEIWVDPDDRLIHARSASRIGYADLGVNRRRVEMLFAELIKAGVASRA